MLGAIARLPTATLQRTTYLLSRYVFYYVCLAISAISNQNSLACTHTQAHVSKVVQSARSLKQEYTQLQKKYEDLQVELADTKEQLEGGEQPRRGSKGAKKGPSVVQLQKTVVELKTRVRKLEKVSGSRR